MSTSSRTFYERLEARWTSSNSLAAVGIDPDIALIPMEAHQRITDASDTSAVIEFFCTEIIKATAEYVCAYKVQPAFFTRVGEAGERALKNVMEFLHTDYPDIPVIMDGKISDISNTVSQYVVKIFNDLNADAVLANPLMGSDTILPLVERRDKGVFVLCKTSNPSSTEILDVLLATGIPLWRYLVQLSLEKWNNNQNIGLVLSANSPADLAGIREIVGETPILLAGVGAQGGDLKQTVSHVIDRRGYGFFVPSSRGVIFAPRSENETFTHAASRAARDLRDSINQLVNH